MQNQNQKKPHVHAEVIKAWADGAIVQARDDFDEWYDCDRPAFLKHTQYRIKPEEKRLKGKYRVALFKYTSGKPPYTVTVDDEQQEKQYETFSDFVTWVTDWIEYNVIDPRQEQTTCRI